MIAALLVLLCAQTPVAQPRIENVQERRIFEEAQQALLADTTLLAEHRGLNAFIANNGALREAEDNFRAVIELPTLRVAQEDFEEVLLADADARAEFHRQIARLAQDTELRAAIGRLQQVENTAPRGVPALPEAFIYLRAHPDVAVAFAARPERVTPLPQTLQPLREAFRRDQALQTALRDAWVVLDAQAGAHEAVYPWWARVYGRETAAALRYRALEAELAPFPSRALAWENREFAWTAYPDAIAPRDQVYARVRRNAVLGPIYFRYLQTLREQPEVAAYAERVFAAAHGEPPAWPAAGSLVKLPPWQRPANVTLPVAPKEPALNSPEAPNVDRPARPTVNRPTGPTRPVAPERTQPSAKP